MVISQRIPLAKGEGREKGWQALPVRRPRGPAGTEGRRYPGRCHPREYKRLHSGRADAVVGREFVAADVLEPVFAGRGQIWEAGGLCCGP